MAVSDSLSGAPAADRLEFETLIPDTSLALLHASPEECSAIPSALIESELFAPRG